MAIGAYLQLLDWTGRQLKPGKRGATPKNAPPILDRLDLSPELWLHAVEHFGKRRTANRVTPAARFNATTGLAPQPVVFGRWKKDGRKLPLPGRLWITLNNGWPRLCPYLLAGDRKKRSRRIAEPFPKEEDGTWWVADDPELDVSQVDFEDVCDELLSGSPGMN